MSHYLVDMKRQNMQKILAIVKLAVPSASILGLKQELFDHLNMTPSLVNKYLKELEELDKVKINLEANTVIAL